MAGTTTRFDQKGRGDVVTSYAAAPTRTVSVDGVAIEGLDNVRLMIGVMSSRRLKVFFFGSEAADDLLNRDPGWHLCNQLALPALRLCGHYGEQGQNNDEADWNERLKPQNSAECRAVMNTTRGHLSI